MTAIDEKTVVNSQAELIDCRRIWEGGQYNMLTDLIRFQGRWLCTFREGMDHAGGGNGVIRVIGSSDGDRWESVARLEEAGTDLRDPHLSIAPDGRLMMTVEGSKYDGRTLKGLDSRVCFSADGQHWSAQHKIVGHNQWLWRATWHKGIAYGVAYTITVEPTTITGAALYHSADGVKWENLCQFDVPNWPNETTLRFDEDDVMHAVMRIEKGDYLGVYGTAKPPYTQWQWNKLNLRLGGPEFLRLPDGRWIIGTRDYRKQFNPEHDAWIDVTTVIGQLNSSAMIDPLLTLPSGGDNSYPGMVWHDGMLWVSYYSSHEGKASIYLAKVKL